MNVRGLPVFELRFAAKSSPAVGSTGACEVAYVPIDAVQRSRDRTRSPVSGLPGDGLNEARYCEPTFVGEVGSA